MNKISKIEITAYKSFKKDLKVEKEKPLLEVKSTKKLKYVTNNINEDLLVVN